MQSQTNADGLQGAQSGFCEATRPGGAVAAARGLDGFRDMDEGHGDLATTLGGQEARGGGGGGGGGGLLEGQGGQSFFGGQASQFDVLRARTQVLSSRMPLGSGAASMLMAVSALAQTPTQNVSDALLGQVQNAAAEGQMQRRASVDGHPSANEAIRRGSDTLLNSVGAYSSPPLVSASAAAMASAADSFQMAAQIGVAQMSMESSAVPRLTGMLTKRSATTDVQLGVASEPLSSGAQTRGAANSGAPFPSQPATAGEGQDGHGNTPIRAKDKARHHPNATSTPPTTEYFSLHPSLPSASILRGGQSDANMLASPTHPSQVPSLGWKTALPLSPRSEARVQVGNIATNVAVYEYIAQSMPSVESTMTMSQNVILGRQFDPNQPLQGVPSTPMMPTPSPAFLPPPDVVMGVRTPFSPSGAPIDTSFVPTYQLAPDEYHALASAAAVVTAALTTASTASAQGVLNESMAGIRLDRSDMEARNDASEGRRAMPGEGAKDMFASEVSRPLTHDEQLEVTETLRAWAGLEGEVRQEEAKLQLQAFGSSGMGSQFIPPDFARHFQSQLTALTAGYYQKLHADGLTKTQNDPSLDKARVFPLPEGEPPRSVWSDGAKGAPNGVQASNEHLFSSDAMSLITQASFSSGLPIDSPQVRDQLLQYAHQLYSTGSKQVTSESEKQRTELHSGLLPLLHTLHKLHPHHLPTLLLLSCAYYSCGDLAASLWYNKLILSIDPNYVESMSNIGTTLRALGRWREAESWWWRAVTLRPGYWDAYENLLGVLCSPQQMPSSEQEEAAAARVTENGELPLEGEESLSISSERQPKSASPRFKEALGLCEFVEGNVMSKRQVGADDDRIRKVPASGGATSTFETTPIFMPAHLPVVQAPRLQNLFYAKGNLKYVLPDLGAIPAAREYEKAVEVLLSPSEDDVYSVRDLVMATYVIALLTLGVSLPGTNASRAATDVASAIGLDMQNVQHVQLAATGQYHLLSPGGGILRLVRASGSRLVSTLLRLGGGGRHLPMLLLLPSACSRLAAYLFAESQGALPALVEAGRRANQNTSAIQSTLQQCQSMTSTILLTLAKLVQDATTRAVVGPHGLLTLDGIPPSTSLLLPLYYLSIAVNPAASTANNLGILLSSIPVTTSVTTNSGERQTVNGQSVALQFYTYGLQLDPKHPHLYTNFGSLLKDLNHLPEAIQMYEKAIECNPKFDVALANLGNAIKDQGRTQESVQYYRRAVEVNPNFPEALCGMVNALLAICDWKDVYADDDEGKQGLMRKVVELLDRQLDEGTHYGLGAISAERRPKEWAELVGRTFGKLHDKEYCRAWQERFESFIHASSAERSSSKINEGSFIIRLIERAMRRTQRQWYIDAYGLRLSSNERLSSITPTPMDVDRYARIKLPSCLGTPAVPSILPFHCFTLKISPRHIRLISHRTALRISQTTLSQPWLPPHVYPPPPPPSPRIRIGYISSDFNNHPLAHLMQSVFGMHDRSQFEVFLYATTPSDQSPYRKKIERESEHFQDVSAWTNQAIIAQILQDGIHIGVNLSGFTKGARNEIFAARPFPLGIHYMGFAGGLAASWNDYSIVDPIACPPTMTSTDIWRTEAEKRPRRLTDFDGDRDPEATDEDWVYPEKFIYMPHSYFVTDHRQGFREPFHSVDSKHSWQEEEERRWKARKEMWPSLPDDFVILSDFNQLYKLEPTVFKLWLRILARVPNCILWLLRFPPAGEAHLLQFARDHFGDSVAARVVFTDVAPKDVHIHRGRIADLFLDTLECGAHTTSADILWSGTPVLTWPKHEHKMASRVAASIVSATGKGDRMSVSSEQEYEDRAVELVKSISYVYVDESGKEVEVQKGDAVFADVLSINPSSSSAKPHKNGSVASTQVLQNKAPAPANVNKMANETNERPQDPLPERATIPLTTSSDKAPSKTVSRRAKGELAELRKELFLSRDSSRLFDTPRWVRNMERGYLEAWQRWVEGTDTEESAEWEALEPDHPAKRSGHIWVTDSS